MLLSVLKVHPKVSRVLAWPLLVIGDSVRLAMRSLPTMSKREHKALEREFDQLDTRAYAYVTARIENYIMNDPATGPGVTLFGIDNLVRHSPLLQHIKTWINETNTTAKVNEVASFVTKRCMVCGSQGRLQACARCELVVYCSKKCQKEDWRRHKTECRLPEPKMFVSCRPC